MLDFEAVSSKNLKIEWVRVLKKEVLFLETMWEGKNCNFFLKLDCVANYDIGDLTLDLKNESSILDGFNFELENNQNLMT